MDTHILAYAIQRVVVRSVEWGFFIMGVGSFFALVGEAPLWVYGVIFLVTVLFVVIDTCADVSARHHTLVSRRQESERRQQQYGSSVVTVSRFPIRQDTFMIEGPPQFCQAVERVLTELRERTPHRYQEVMQYFPQAIYDPSIRAQGAAATSLGEFSMDGSDYGYFRWVFLHEVGHTVYGQRDGNWSEEAANSYAHQVTAELG